jgi:hypothetical protein
MKKRTQKLCNSKVSCFGFQSQWARADRAGDCPCCPKDAKPDPDKAAFKAGLVEILGDDEDGIAAAMEDLGL